MDSALKPLKAIMKLIVILALVALLGIVNMVTLTAHAQTAHQAAPLVDTSTCTQEFERTFEILCIGPSIQTTCSGQQFFPATDGFGVPIDWTFTDQNNTCVHVSYSMDPSFSNCSILFYVPDGNATATFGYSWFNGSTHFGSLNENPVNGWQTIQSSAGRITSLSFNDHDSPGALRLGWGSNSGHSLKVICS